MKTLGRVEQAYQFYDNELKQHMLFVRANKEKLLQFIFYPLGNINFIIIVGEEETCLFTSLAMLQIPKYIQKEITDLNEQTKFLLLMVLSSAI